MIPTLLPKKSLPEFLRAGDAHAWNLNAGARTLDDAAQLPPVSVFYTLTAVIANAPVRQQIAAVAVAANGIAAFTLGSTITAAWAPGCYQWVCFGTDAAGNRFELAQGVLRIEPDPAAANPTDPRSHNVKLLANIRALLQGKSLDDVAIYKIGGRELTKMDLPNLLKWEGLIESRVRRERIRRGEFVKTKTKGIQFGGRGGR